MRFKFAPDPSTRSLHLLIVDFRILEERRERPVFETDRPTSPGKFEFTPKSNTSRGACNYHETN